MKLSAALAIVLASTPSGSAFSPSAIANHHRVGSQIRLPAARPIAADKGTRLAMVGGGMIERPPGGDDSGGDSGGGASGADAEPESASAGGASSSSADPYTTYTEEKEKFLAKLGRDIAIDPWDPNPYIKPRPGKYGWDEGRASVQEQLAEAKLLSDEDIAARGQTMTDGEREENLNVIRRLRQNDVPVLRRSGDLLAAAEAAADANAREKEDPWFDLNERLADAVKYQTEDVAHLKALIAKVGGPPPQLVKLAENPRGYVLRTEVIGMQMSNERLEKMIDRRAAMDDEAREEQRREAVRKQMSKLDSPVREENELAEIEEIARRREENYLRGIMDQEARASQYNEMMKDEQKEYEKKREELLKRLGVGGESEVEYMGAQSEFVDKTMKDFVTDLKRMNNLFDDEEEEELGLGDEAVGDETHATEGRPMSKAAQARAEAMKNDGSGRPRLPGDADVTRGELDPDVDINESSSAKTGPLTVEVTSAYNAENSDPPMRKHCFQYTVRITNDSPSETVQLLSRRFEIQTVGSSMKDVVQGEGVTGRQPVLKPGEVFEYTSTAPLSVRPIGTTEIAARMSGEYRYCTLGEGQDKATEEQVNKGRGEAGAELATFHFVFPEEQRVKPVRPSDDDDDDNDDDAVKTTTVTSSSASPAPSPPPAKDAAAASSGAPASSLPGEPDMTSGNISSPSPNDASDTLTSDVRVVVTSAYRPERSDVKLDKHCFAYNVRITNESKDDVSIQLVSRRFEIQTVGSANKDVVQGPGVTGRQPVLKSGESFEYTSTAPLSVRPMLDKTRVVARMSGEYNFVKLGEDGKTPLSSTPLKAELGSFHFILPE